MSYIRKTEDEFEIETTFKDAKQQLQFYKQNV